MVLKAASDNKSTNDEDEKKRKYEISLLSLVVGGDPNSFAKIVELHINIVTQIAFYMTGSRDTADDIAQDVFISLWRNRAKLDPARPLRPYLVRSIRNRVFDEHKGDVVRSRYKDSAIAESLAGSISSEVPSHENGVIERADIQNALEELPARRRLALQLYLIDELSEQEIADAMGASAQATDRLIRRALADLKNFLKLSR